jgi:hypothetical protein
MNAFHHPTKTQSHMDDPSTHRQSKHSANQHSMTAMSSAQARAKLSCGHTRRPSQDSGSHQSLKECHRNETLHHNSQQMAGVEVNHSSRSCCFPHLLPTPSSKQSPIESSPMTNNEEWLRESHITIAPVQMRTKTRSSKSHFNNAIRR